MGPLYARYVPPKPAAAAAPPSVQEVIQKEAIRKEVTPKKSVAKVKDSSGGKKRKRAEVEDSRRKKSPSPVDGDGPSIPKKHTGVLDKFQKATKLSEAAKAAAKDAPVEQEDQPELHDIVPLPQPERAPTPEYAPDFSALPPWLAKPTIVSQSTTRPFNELALSSKTLTHLESKGYTTAFAVQAALLPLLLPHPYLTRLPPNDVCVSAPTGSGKTLAYVLPIIEDLRNRMDTKLRAVIVVPTRELVAQAYSVASTCASGSSIQIALAVGNQTIAAEQEHLVKKGRVYDPERYSTLMAKAKRRIRFDEDSDEEDTDSTILHDLVRMPPNYVPTYTSAVDLLICTPGRLVEHLATTAGFDLNDVEWLVVDEADRLLDQSFQEWVSKVTAALDVQKKSHIDFTENPELGQLLRIKDRYVRKVILSATMTRDVSKLSALRLRRPTMVVVKTEGDNATATEAEAATTNGEFELPTTLKEFAIPVGDGSDKPLYLLELLKTKILPGKLQDVKMDDDSDDTSSSDDSSSSDDDSDSSDDSSSSADESDSDSTSEKSTSDSESSSSEDSSSEDSSSEDSSSEDSSSEDSSSEDSSSEDSDSESDNSASTTTSKPTKATSTPTSTSEPGATILIFTPSTEAASRLHHLITHIQPSYAPLTTLLTKSTSTLHLPNKHKTRIIISTDRASRGLDLPNLTHVINYSIPRSLASYVHRVGRTARAGRGGEAWTLFAENEGRWFWNEVARGKVGRRGKVERVNMKLGADEVEMGVMRERYEGALESIKKIVVGKGRKGKKGEDVEMGGT